MQAMITMSKSKAAMPPTMAPINVPPSFDGVSITLEVA